MTVKKAAAIFKAAYPEEKIVGYWMVEEGILFTVNIKGNKSRPEPAQYMVRQDGTVYATLFFRYGVDLKDMQSYAE